MSTSISSEENFKDLLPLSWNPQVDGHTFWVTCFRIMLGNSSDLPTGWNQASFADGLVLVINGSISYQFVPDLKIESVVDNGLVFGPITAEERTLNPGLHLLIVLPYDRPNCPGVEPTTRSRVDEIIGLASICLGRNAVYERVFDNVYDLSTTPNQYNSTGAACLNPLTIPRPMLDSQALKDMKLFESRIAELPSEEEAKVRLGVRWFEGSRAEVHLDAFLAAWFALEVVGMADTNVRSLHTILGRVYGISEQAARAEFQLGMIQGFRSEIVHHGRRPPIHFQLIAYLQGVFQDVLREKLNLSPLFVARGILLDSSQPIAGWFPYRKK